MQSRAVRCAVPVNHGKRPDPDSHGVAFVVANRISIPAGRDLSGMLYVHAHMADLMINGIENGDLVGLLEDLQSIGRKNEWHPSGPTLVARSRIAEMR